jgi:hypothetical protein
VATTRDTFSHELLEERRCEIDVPAPPLLEPGLAEVGTDGLQSMAALVAIADMCLCLCVMRWQA